MPILTGVCQHRGQSYYLTSFTLSSVYKTKWLEVPGEMRRTEMASLHRPQLQGCWAQLYSLCRRVSGGSHDRGDFVDVISTNWAMV